MRYQDCHPEREGAFSEKYAMWATNSLQNNGRLRWRNGEGA